MSITPPLWLVALVAAAVGAAGAAGVARNHYRAEIADIHAAQARDEATASKVASEWVAAAVQRGDALSADLASTEADLARKSLEVSHALRKLTTGRPCLDGGAVGVLNRTYAPPAVAPVPAAAGTPAATDGATATDTDVGDWIAHAWDRYETCRGRLDKLISYEEGVPHGKQ